jgi:hypothetical protein
MPIPTLEDLQTQIDDLRSHHSQVLGVLRHELDQLRDEFKTVTGIRGGAAKDMEKAIRDLSARVAILEGKPG